MNTPKVSVRIFCIKSLKGGVGKTTLAFYLAAKACLDRSCKRRVLLVDMDILGSSPFLLAEDQIDGVLTFADVLDAEELRDKSEKGESRLLQIGVTKPDHHPYLSIAPKARGASLPKDQFDYIGLTYPQKEELGSYRSEVQAFREFRSLFCYIEHLASVAGKNESILSVLIDMPPGKGAPWRALKEAAELARRAFLFEQRDILVILPTRSEYERSRRLKGNGYDKLVVNMVTDTLCNFMSTSWKERKAPNREQPVTTFDIGISEGSKMRPTPETGARREEAWQDDNLNTRLVSNTDAVIQEPEANEKTDPVKDAVYVDWSEAMSAAFGSNAEVPRVRLRSDWNGWSLNANEEWTPNELSTVLMSR